VEGIDFGIWELPKHAASAPVTVTAVGATSIVCWFGWLADIPVMRFLLL
jgi:hypothetical protein